MPEAGFSTNIALPRLPRVKFPGMEIEHSSLTINLIDTIDDPARHAVGVKAKKSTTARWHDFAHDFHGRNRNLDDT